MEALCAQEDVSKCVESLVASKGISAVAQAFRFSPDRSFLNGPATAVLNHLSDPSVKQFYGGQYLHRVLEQIVQPPTLWNIFVEAHDAHYLTPDGTRAFAWLLLELLQSLDIRNLGQKIKHVLESTSGDCADGGPGGQHDNDHADYRNVKILPTPDEFASLEPPFYRRADAVQSVDVE